MPGTIVSRGNLLAQFLLQPTLTPVTVTVSANSEQTFTVQGLLPGDVVEVMSNVTPTAGMAIGNARVSAANTLQIQFISSNTSAKVPASGVYNVIVSRPEQSPAPSADA